MSLETLILSSNLSLAFINLFIIDFKLVKTLNISQIIEIIDSTLLFIFSLFSFILKHNGSLWKIHYLLYFSGQLVNDHIIDKAFTLLYTLLQKLSTKVLTAKRSVILIK